MKRLFIMAAAMAIAITANARESKKTICETNGKELTEYRDAKFPTEEGACSEWIAQHLKYPSICAEEGIEGTVLTRFEIDAEGNISNIRASDDCDYLLAKEAVRVVSMMPKWQPATSNGLPVSALYVLPIRFTLSNN